MATRDPRPGTHPGPRAPHRVVRGPGRRRDDSLFHHPGAGGVEARRPRAVGLCVRAVSALGALMILSSTRGTDPDAYDLSFLRRQVLFIGIGVVGHGAGHARRLPAAARLRLAPVRRRGAGARLWCCRRWGPSGAAPRRGSSSAPFQLQPAELAKVGTIFAMAALLARFEPPLSIRRLGLGLAAVRRARGADPGPARPRDGAGVRRHHHGHGVRGGRPGPAHRGADCVRRGRDRRRAQLGPARGLPARSPHRVPRPGSGPAGRDVQPRPVEGGHRLRRGVGQGPVRGDADPPGVRARAAHRLHLHGPRRGAGLRRVGHAPGPVRAHVPAHPAARRRSPTIGSARSSASASCPCWSSRSSRTWA